MDENKLAIERMNSLQNSKYPILTVYLSGVRKEAPSARLLLSQFHSLIKKGLSAEEKKIFKKDIEKVEQYLTGQYDKRGKHSIVFFSNGKKLWEVLSFDYFLPPLCLVNYSPYLSPIDEAKNWSTL